MMLPRRCIAISAALLLASLFAGAAVAAEPAAGKVTQVSGPLFAQYADGRVKVLSQDSLVAPGDTLVSGRTTYAQVTFTDRSIVTLAPDSKLAIDAYSFDASQPSAGRAELDFIQGGLGVASGALGKGGKRFKLKTPTGTIDVADAAFILGYVPSDESKVASMPPIRLAALSPAFTGTTSDASPAFIPAYEAPVHLTLTTPVPGAKSPGLYVQVLDGIIHLTNSGGSQSFAAGQFGYTASFTKPPVVVPANPGIQFTPPPSFSAPPSSSSSSGKPSTVDCEVR
jgi:hypothetical protein